MNGSYSVGPRAAQLAALFVGVCGILCAVLPISATAPAAERARLVVVRAPAPLPGDRCAAPRVAVQGAQAFIAWNCADGLRLGGPNDLDPPPVVNEDFTIEEIQPYFDGTGHPGVAGLLRPRRGVSPPHGKRLFLRPVADHGFSAEAVLLEENSTIDLEKPQYVLAANRVVAQTVGPYVTEWSVDGSQTLSPQTLGTGLQGGAPCSSVDGRWLSAWQRADPGTAPDEPRALEIVATWFTQDGVSQERSLGSSGGVVLPIPVGTQSSLRPSVLCLPKETVVAWESGSATRDIVARRLNLRGKLIGKPISLAARAEGDQISPLMAALPGGGFLAIWEERSSRVAIVGRVFSAAARPLTGDLLLAVVDGSPRLDLGLRIHVSADRRVWLGWSVDGAPWFGVWEHRR